MKTFANKRISIKIIFLSMWTIFLIICFAGCGNQYSAKIITSGFDFQENFLTVNKTYGAYYKNSNSLSEQDDWEIDNSSPETRTYIIKDQITLDEIFSDFPKTDLNRKMILVHGFTTASNNEYKISEVILNENNLQIKYGNSTSQSNNSPNASIPLTKWVIVLIDKIKVETAEFSFIGEVNSML